MVREIPNIPPKQLDQALFLSISVHIISSDIDLVLLPLRSKYVFSTQEAHKTWPNARHKTETHVQLEPNRRTDRDKTLLFPLELPILDQTV